ncbi:MAG: ABC transporter permease [Dehalococcoidales bacterium]
MDRVWKKVLTARLLPVAVVSILYLIHNYTADAVVLSGKDYFNWLLLAFFVAGLSNFLAFILWKRRNSAVERIIVLASIVILAWDLIVTKFALLKPPFFPTPGQVVQAYSDDLGILLSSALYSLRILASGYLMGVAIGVSIGFLVGWYKLFRQWCLPLLKVVGPIPATALTALAIAIFPGFSGSIFLIAFATIFPVFMSTWSGVANVPKSLLETAQNLGADDRFLVRRVVFPAALPSIFTGLYIGLLVSFLTLVVAEMLGVKAGLGWYIWRAQGWAEYYRVYAAVIIMGFLYSFLLSALFSIRNRLLRWQKGVIRW